MGKIEKDKDAESVKMEKKLKKGKKNRSTDLPDVGDGNSHVEVDGGHAKEKVHKHKEKKRKSESNEKHNLEEDNGEFPKKDKKKKKRKSDSLENNPSSEKANDQGRDDGPVVEQDCDPQPIRKEKKRKHKHHSLEKELENDGERIRGEKSEAKKKKKSRDGKEIEKSSKEYTFQKNDKKEKKKKKKKKTNEITTEESGKKGSEGKKEEKKNLEKPKAKGKSKRVSFSGHVEVFPSPEEQHKSKGPEGNLVRGKRFTPEEDAIVKEAVLKYVEAHGLGEEEGLKMVLTCKSHSGMSKCWKEIGTCIPYRPYSAVYYRAHVLFERAESRSWTPEEIKFLQDFHKEHGNNWKKAATELGKHRVHVKDTWRRIKVKNHIAGRWTQEEYQNLYDLVNLDLQMKVTAQEKKSKHGMLRDDIPWGAISDKLSTRSDATCCFKWYNQLTSSLVAEKKWSDADDYRLIGALYELDAPCAEDVDWDTLLGHRPGEICRKRWDQMVRHVGHKGSKPFAELVDTLAKRYCPDLAEIREAWDNKPVVP